MAENDPGWQLARTRDAQSHNSKGTNSANKLNELGNRLTARASGREAALPTPVRPQQRPAEPPEPPCAQTPYRNREAVSGHCFKPLSLWQFVAAALETNDSYVS